MTKSADGKYKGKKISIASLVALLGEPATLRLCRTYNGFVIPSAQPYLIQKRNRQVVALWKKGYDVAALAARFRLSPKGIWKLIAKYTTTQGKLVPGATDLYELPRQEPDKVEDDP